MGTSGDDEARPGGAAWADWLSRSVIYASSMRPGGPGTPDQGPDSAVRASDAERSQIADALSRHYAEGRLDQQEFEDRLKVAMSARTRGDLVPLLRDLPPTTLPLPPETTSRLSRVEHRAREVTLIIASVAILCGLVWLVHGDRTALIVFGVIALDVALRRLQRTRSRRQWHDHLHEHGTPHWHGSRGKVKLESGAHRPPKLP